MTDVTKVDAAKFPTTIQDLFGLKGKVALILGGGLGHGEVSAKWLAHAGCDVIIAEIIPERAARVAGDIRAMGRRAYEAVADMTDLQQAQAVLAKAEAELGGPDIVVSIIGEAAWVSFLETSVEDWRNDLRRNLDYFFFCTQWAARSMVKRGTGGAIVAIASVDGMQSSPMHAPYGAAKAGIISLVKTMAVELAPHDIRVNAIAPGTIKTPRAVSRSSVEAADQRARDVGIPLGRAGAIEEIGHAVLWLASDMSRYVTGITLPVDGGWLAARLDIGRYSPPRKT
jgi:NAD(P)-dependent dehydrogenase (short-subunit alcohol dehydrogenase family)